MTDRPDLTGAVPSVPPTASARWPRESPLDLALAIWAAKRTGLAVTTQGEGDAADYVLTKLREAGISSDSDGSGVAGGAVRIEWAL